MRAMPPTGDILPAQLGWNLAREKGHSTYLFPLQQEQLSGDASLECSLPACSPAQQQATLVHGSKSAPVDGREGDRAQVEGIAGIVAELLSVCGIPLAEGQVLPRALEQLRSTHAS